MRPIRTTVLGALATVSAVALVAAAAPSGFAAQDDIPIKGQALTMGVATQGDPAVVTVHGVRRTDKATIVYWSLGMPKNAPADARGLTYMGTSTTAFTEGFGLDVQGDVGLLDVKGAKAYLPLKPVAGSTQCLCPGFDSVMKVDPGHAGIVWSAISPLPADVTHVDVAVAEQIIPNVPVEDGIMEPLAESDELPYILGLGWPKIDEEAIAAATPRTPAPITARISDLADTVTTTKGEVALNADVLFAKDSATLGPKAAAALTAAAAKIKESAGGKALTVTGHTDADASTSYNLTLSQKRAEAVASQLRAKLGGGYTVTAVGKGESQPIADNGTAAGQAKNRRVSVTFSGGK